MLRVVFICFISFSILFSQSNNYFSFGDFDDEFNSKKIDSSCDPLKFYNRSMTQFNDFVYMYIMGPIAKGYRYIVSKPIREGVSNVFYNIQFPIRFTNNILQLKFNNALEESARFIINSTYGLAGFFDIAKSEGGINRHDEDFGQTLGFYGVGNGIHIVLPFLGPSNLRDAIGLVADSLVNPIYYTTKGSLDSFKSDNLYLLLNTHNIINEYSLHVDEYENIRKNSLDLYKLLKSVYEQRRERQIQE